MLIQLLYVFSLQISITFREVFQSPTQICKSPLSSSNLSLTESKHRALSSLGPCMFISEKQHKPGISMLRIKDLSSGSVFCV